MKKANNPYDVLADQVRAGVPGAAAEFRREFPRQAVLMVHHALHGGNPRFVYKKLVRGIDPILLADLKLLYGNLARVMREAGFVEVRYRLFAGGIVALHTGVGAA